MASKTTFRQIALYIGVLAASFFVALIAGWLFGVRINAYAYDWITRRFADSVSKPAQSIVVAIDPETLSDQGGMHNIRPILTKALDDLAETQPAVVASDVILHDAEVEAEDKRLAASLRATRNLILPCDVVPVKDREAWEDPLPLFADATPRLPGHVHLSDQEADGVNRLIPLEKIADGKQRWALALEALSAYRGQPVVQSLTDLQVADIVIPTERLAKGRPLLIRYLPAGSIPKVSATEILQNKDLLRGKVVFLGITALSAAHDRLLNPFGESIAGVEVHAQAFETMVRRDFLVPAGDGAVLGVCVLFAIAAGLIFAYVPGWLAYVLDFLLIAAASWIPVETFRHGIVFPYFGPAAVAVLCSAAAAIFQHFFVRRELLRSESEKSRYQQAIHWVAHEMRTPLTAIQGSSEIMTRYKLPEEKGRQLSEMINSESKRMARMIQTFLDVERLADGQMELKQERFEAREIVEACLKRIASIAERKQIATFLDTPVEGLLTGDRELMEYAFYNLLTNAVKYSPSNTEVHITAALAGSELRLAVRDQGIGMEADELKRIFKKFYRTKRAEQSGEVGTGIGLSIVEQIVTHHKGRIEVTSEPGKGSCFIMILNASRAKVPQAAEVSADIQNAKTFDR